MITKRGLWMIYLNYENKKVPKVKGRGLLVYIRYKQNAMGFADAKLRTVLFMVFYGILLNVNISLIYQKNSYVLSYYNQLDK